MYENVFTILLICEWLRLLIFKPYNTQKSIYFGNIYTSTKVLIYDIWYKDKYFPKSIPQTYNTKNIHFDTKILTPQHFEKVKKSALQSKYPDINILHFQQKMSKCKEKEL